MNVNNPDMVGADDEISNTATDTNPSIDALSEGAEIAEPTKKRAYKQRAPKIKPETLDANETPSRKPRAKKASIESSAKQLEGIHKMVAMLPNMGFMEINPAEARILAEAMAGVAEEYEIQISGKTGATIQLLSAAAMIYAPRAMYAYKMRKAPKQDAVVLATDGNPEQPLQ